jgi:uncharacterized protein YkwD
MATRSGGLYEFAKNLCDDNSWNLTSLRWKRYGMPALLCVLVVLICSNPTPVSAQARSAKPNATKGTGSETRPKLETLKETLLKAKRYVYEYTNEERVSRGLPKLEPSPALNQVANRHSLNMCQSGSFRHESDSFPEGWRTFPKRLKNVGLSSGGENIGYQTIVRNSEKWAKGMVKGWMDSPAHRKNILDTRFRYMGVGIRPCKNKLGYATQVFSENPGENR